MSCTVHELALDRPPMTRNVTEQGPQRLSPGVPCPGGTEATGAWMAQGRTEHDRGPKVGRTSLMVDCGFRVPLSLAETLLSGTSVKDIATQPSLQVSLGLMASVSQKLALYLPYKHVP